MASWMVHLRVADRLIDKLPPISNTEFVIGNIAPDSGVPNEDWSVFTPSSEISHFRTTDAYGLKEIHEDQFLANYFTKEQCRQYSPKQYAFYLGYLTHLLTDKMWVRDIVQPSRLRFPDLYENDRGKWAQLVKGDWHALDILYLHKHPDFRSFILYERAIGFQNTYLDFFSIDAFDNRREYITATYRKESVAPKHQETYLSEDDIEVFVTNGASEIISILHNLQSIADF